MTDPMPPGVAAVVELESETQRLQSLVEQDVLDSLTRKDLQAAAASRESSSKASAVPTLVVENDVYRESAVRLLGYANELGEAFRPFSPALVAPSYAIAWAYVAMDTADKARRAYAQTQAAGAEANPQGVSPTSASFAYGVDTLLWQGIASVVLPGYIINRFVAFTGQVGALAQACLPGVKLPVKGLSTAVGLLTIPFLIAPVDDATHGFLDKYIRPRLGITPHSTVLAAQWAEGEAR